jgi:uncharacterized protein (TIGR02118 family)
MRSGTAIVRHGAILCRARRECDSCKNNNFSVDIDGDLAKLVGQEMATMLNRRDFIGGAATGVGAMAVMSSEMVKAAQGPTMSLNVIYPNHDGARFDVNYYRSTHIPLAMKVMKAASVMLIEGVSMESAAAPYAMIAHFQFASSEAVTAARANPAMAEVRADIAKFTDIKPIVMLGKSL